MNMYIYIYIYIRTFIQIYQMFVPVCWDGEIPLRFRHVNGPLPYPSSDHEPPLDDFFILYVELIFVATLV